MFYLKKFNSSDEYSSFISSEEYLSPNVSVVPNEKRVYYNIHIPNYFRFVAVEDSSIMLSGMNMETYELATGIDLQYSKDGKSWTQYNFTAIPLNAGETLYLKGDNPNGFSTPDMETFTGYVYSFGDMPDEGDYTTGKYECHGNIMSLLYGDDFEGKTTIPSAGCFYGLFKYCDGLLTAPELPATILASDCYQCMFDNCINLTTAPELPATELAPFCYFHMFWGCTSLTTAPELPATTLASDCYSCMFYECTSLVNVPKILPANRLAVGCYCAMFIGCASLVNAPELPATTLADYCYDSMFYNCTSLTTAPALPATNLAEGCYWNMFYGCTSLVNAPELPATNLAPYCYDYTFGDCASLVNAPELPAKTLAAGCYQSMFDGCSSLTTAPELPATTLANDCYYGMFYGCTSLVNAPELPATNLAPYCYDYMFGDCASLVNAPELPATTLADYCYENMFNDCTSLTTAPELPATTLANDCYYGMFSGCSSLNQITMLATDISAFNCLKYWVSGVASTGTFIKHKDMTSLPTGNNGIPEGWEVQDYIEPQFRYLIFEALEDGTFSFSQNDINYLISDGSAGGTLTDGSSTPTVSAGSKVMWKINNPTISSTTGIGTFSSTGKFNVEGNVMSLLYGDDFIGQTDLTGKDYAFYNLFKNCNQLIDAKDLILPATTLDSYCYQSMFENCTSLTTVPKLPSTNLAEGCYSAMFRGCTSLVNVPALPAKTLAEGCYDNMFNDCNSLTTAPALPATILTEYCYNEMFNGCNSLNNITMLATDISANQCLNNWVNGVASTGTFTKHEEMTSLPTGVNGIPEGWEVEDYVDYQSKYLTFVAIEGSSIMLSGMNTETFEPDYTIDLQYSKDGKSWTQYDFTAIPLTAGETLYMKGNNPNGLSILDMESGRGRLYSFGDPFGTGNYTTGKYECHGNIMSLIYGDNAKDKTTIPSVGCFYGLFVGCDGLITAPELPATTLAFGCYYRMFYSCYSLVNAPALPATILTEYCYNEIFSGCSSLNNITMLATDISASSCLYNWVSGVASTGTFTKHKDMTSLPTGVHGIPEGWEVKNHITPTECTSLTITADDVDGKDTTTTIYYTAICTGIDYKGDTVTGIIEEGTAVSAEFPQNTSETETAERTITFEFMGVTASTVITQGVLVKQSYTIDLNNQWELSSTISNPDSSLYNGVYQSFSNKGVNSSAALMYIDIVGYTSFKFYVRSYAESSYDFVVVSNLDSTLTSGTTGGTAVKMTTKGNQNSGTSISSYTLVEFTGIDSGEHRITVMYRKDTSDYSGDDRGYVLIPKNQ